MKKKVFKVVGLIMVLVILIGCGKDVTKYATSDIVVQLKKDGKIPLTSNCIEIMTYSDGYRFFDNKTKYYIMEDRSKKLYAITCQHLYEKDEHGNSIEKKDKDGNAIYYDVCVYDDVTVRDDKNDKNDGYARDDDTTNYSYRSEDNKNTYRKPRYEVSRCTEYKMRYKSSLFFSKYEYID